MNQKNSEISRPLLDRAYDILRFLAFFLLSMIYGLIIGGFVWGATQKCLDPLLDPPRLRVYLKNSWGKILGELSGEFRKSWEGLGKIFGEKNFGNFLGLLGVSIKRLIDSLERYCRPPMGTR